MTSITTEQTTGSPDSVRSLISGLRELSIAALRRMYLPERKMFTFRLRRNRQGDVLEGISRRYTAITLLGLAGESDVTHRQVLHGQEILSVAERLLDDVHTVDNLGDVALTLWAGAAVQAPMLSRAVRRLRQLEPWEGPCPTVELAWTVTALCQLPRGLEGHEDHEGLARRLADRLMASFSPASELFPHWPTCCSVSPLREHVTCFADWVYPVQSLAHYHKYTGNTEALAVADRCAARMCNLQGPAGQWWWHFDVRTGKVVEGYPVYAVHQDAMAPMALFDLREAGGGDYRIAIDRGLAWLTNPPERSDSLIDRDAGVIWRKIARREPRKLARSVQAISSWVHPSFRFPGINLALRPGAVDYECRPYHLGWLLYAWPSHRAVE